MLPRISVTTQVAKDLVKVCNNLLNVEGGKRLAHTDLATPNFNKFRYSSNLEPTKQAKVTDMKALDSFFLASCLAGVLIQTKGVAHGIVEFLQPNKNIMCSANLEVDLNKIPEGKGIIVSWNSKPVFVRHRSEKEMKQQLSIDVGGLRDPTPDVDRFHDMKWQVMLGVCTHLGCVPIADKGDYGGFYCPCHGSHYDVAGRIRKGPAPRNLDVPPYKVTSDSLIIGTI